MAEDQNWGFADYACRMLDECVDTVSRLRNESTVNLLGVCQGGTFTLCYTALYGHKVRNLVTMVTPVDFQTEDNVLSSWVRKVDLDRLVGCYGNVPGSLLNALFVSLQPFRLGSKKYLDLADLADNPDGLELLREHFSKEDIGKLTHIVGIKRAVRLLMGHIVKSN